MVKNERQVMMQLDEAGLTIGGFSRAWSRGLYFCWAQSAVDEGSIDLSGTGTGIFADVTVMS